MLLLLTTDRVQGLRLWRKWDSTVRYLLICTVHTDVRKGLARMKYISFSLSLVFLRRGFAFFFAIHGRFLYCIDVAELPTLSRICIMTFLTFCWVFWSVAYMYVKHSTVPPHVFVVSRLRCFLPPHRIALLWSRYIPSLVDKSHQWKRKKTSKLHFSYAMAVYSPPEKCSLSGPMSSLYQTFFEWQWSLTMHEFARRRLRNDGWVFRDCGILLLYAE